MMGRARANPVALEARQASEADKGLSWALRVKYANTFALDEALTPGMLLGVEAGRTWAVLDGLRRAGEPWGSQGGPFVWRGGNARKRA